MKYIIQSTIVFDTTEYILRSLSNSNTSVKLSNSAGRVLKELIELRDIDELVTREHLFSIVWRAHGLEPSNGNLNQQISLIRKTFTYFGLDASSIITVPKRGLKLNNQLIVEKIDEKKKTCLSSSSNKIADKNDNLSSPMLLNIKANMKYMITLTIMMVIICSTGFVHLYTKKDNIKLYCCKEINSCNICTFNAEPEFDCNNCAIQCNKNT